MRKLTKRIGLQFFGIHSQRLNENTVYSSLFNLIRLVGVLGAKLQIDDSNANRYRMEGGRYEDTLYWVSCDILSSYIFDPNDTNVLAPGQRVVPAYKTITVNQVRQISLYLPTYFLSSQAFQSANYFDEFTALAQSMLSKTKKLYDQRLVFIRDGLPDRGDRTVYFFTNNDHRATSQPSVRMVSSRRIIFSRMGPKYQGTSFIISFR